MLLRELFEDKGKACAFAVGRMNPATNGHELLVNAIKQQPGDAFLFLTDRAPKLPDNPLTPQDKLEWARKSFDGITIELAKNVFPAAVKLYEAGYRDVTFLEGENKLGPILEKYNGEEGAHGFYDFNLNFVKLERNADADDATGMSGTKIREFVTNDDLENFTKAVTDKAKPHAEEMFKKLQDILGVKEIMGFATRTPKRATVTRKKREPEELSVADKLKKRRALATKIGTDKAFRSDVKLTDRELTKKEYKKKKEYADKLPDGDFKDRYGKEWKAVKYATATKMAKKHA
jgi:hypothetical protein|tara:strand:+ start:164 stop:1033 length:870 start_codon:yes stop_codon:yes gene_type:complete